jgi:hypothetical protein
MPRTWIWTRIRTWTGSVAGVRERRVSRSDSSDVIRAIDIRSGRHTRAWPDGGGPALRSGSRNRQAARVEFFTPAHAWSKITRLPGSAAVVVGAAAVLPRSIATVTGQSSSVVDRTTSSPGTPSSAPAAREGIPTSSASPGRSPFRPCDTTASCGSGPFGRDIAIGLPAPPAPPAPRTSVVSVLSTPSSSSVGARSESRRGETAAGAQSGAPVWPGPLWPALGACSAGTPLATGSAEPAVAQGAATLADKCGTQGVLLGDRHPTSFALAMPVPRPEAQRQRGSDGGGNDVRQWAR